MPGGPAPPGRAALGLDHALQRARQVRQLDRVAGLVGGAVRLQPHPRVVRPRFDELAVRRRSPAPCAAAAGSRARRTRSPGPTPARSSSCPIVRARSAPRAARRERPRDRGRRPSIVLPRETYTNRRLPLSAPSPDRPPRRPCGCCADRRGPAPSPPRLYRSCSTTPPTSIAATPASNALPPFSSISNAAAVVSGCPADTAALRPITGG